MQMKLDFTTPTKKGLKLEENKENSTSEMQPPTKRLKAKRCLFGASDPGRVRDLLQQELDSILKDSIDKYDFDFRAELPIEDHQARFEWSQISISEVPKVYLQRTSKSPDWHISGHQTPPTPRKPRQSPRHVEYEQSKIDHFVPIRRRSSILSKLRDNDATPTKKRKLDCA